MLLLLENKKERKGVLSIFKTYGKAIDYSRDNYLFHYNLDLSIGYFKNGMFEINKI